ncbi:MAG TPA: CocE/NonD family hydrolase [Candidatus Polarisedimenticolaceae bacterium]|nr:CocE/NonD family hydrolase [Candidatus Polarisedimenticolaceae bacterium]
MRSFPRLSVSATLALIGAASLVDAREGATGALVQYWRGGFGSMTGNRLEWTHLRLELEERDGSLSGSGILLAGPQLPSPVRLRAYGRMRATRIELTFDDRDSRVACEGHGGSEFIEGECRRHGGRVDLRLVRVEPEVRADSLLGVYDLDGGHRVQIGRDALGLLMIDLRTGVVRSLFHKGGETYVAGPSLSVGHPAQWRLAFERDSGGAVTAVRIVDPSGASRRAVRRAGWAEEDYSVLNERDGVMLRGTLTLPARDDAPLPAIVWVHGSGPVTRHAAQFFPHYFADLGFAVLAVDKRGVGGSAGEYALPDGSSDNVRHLLRSADDVAWAIKTLKRDPRIDPTRIGLVGVSQAGWVMPAAAALETCAFTITLSGGATELSREAFYSALTREELADASLPSIDELLPRVRSMLPTDLDWTPTFARQPCPGLWLYGMKDRVNPSQLSIELLDWVRAFHDKDFTIVAFPDGNHALLDVRIGGLAGHHVADRFVPDLFVTIERWLGQLWLASEPPG